MELDRKQLKREAKAALAEHRPSAYLVTLAYLLILLVLSALSFRLRYPGLGWADFAALYAGSMDEDAILQMFAGEPGLVGRLLYYAIEIMTLIVGVGFISFCLLVSRREEAGFGSLFDGFGIFFRALWLSILRSLVVLLWALPALIGMALVIAYFWGMMAAAIFYPLWIIGVVLMVVGIVLELIAAYRYSMCFFILLDAPDKGAAQCLRESREMTRGYKGKLFVLDLSFLGWTLLSLIPFVALYTLPYMQVTLANYYRVLSGRWEMPKHIDVVI